MRELMKHKFNVTQAAFWDLYLSPSFTQALHEEGMNCSTFEILSDTGLVATGLERALRSTPRVELPSAVKKILGKSVSYTEAGKFDPDTQRYTFQVVPASMPGKIKIGGVIWLVPIGECEIERFCELEFSVNLFGVGKMVEQVIAKSYIENQEKAAGFTRAWIEREK